MSSDIVLHGDFDLAKTNPIEALQKAQTVVQWMAEKCKGPAYISMIQGRQYPKVDWWTTVGMSLGLFPVEVSNDRIRDQEDICYLAVVEVRHGDQLVTRASAICSSKEEPWADRDEHAIRSMAATRATGKAFRIGLSGLAVLAGLEPTPAEEMPAAMVNKNEHWCEAHQTNWFKRGKMRNFAHPIGDSKEWCGEPSEKRGPVVVQFEKEDVGPSPTEATPSAPAVRALTEAQLRAQIEAEGIPWQKFEIQVLGCTWATFIKRTGSSKALALSMWGTWK